MVSVHVSVGIKVGFLTRVVGVLVVGDEWVCVVVGIGGCQCRFKCISSVCVGACKITVSVLVSGSVSVVVANGRLC